MISTRCYLHTKESRKGTRSLYMDVRCDGVARLRQAVGETLKAKDWNPNLPTCNNTRKRHSVFGCQRL